MPLDDAINVYTDGSSFSGPRSGGIGIRLVIINALGGEESEDVPLPGYAGATNNQMELYAILMMVEGAESESTIECHTDSKLAIGWLVHQWTRNDPVIDELVRAIWMACGAKQIFVNYTKVKGHADCAGNIKVDYLAQQESRHGYHRMMELQ